jgi:hypothetical protein
MGIFESHIWQDWLVARKYHLEINPNFSTYLDNTFSSYVIGYGWYGGKLIEQSIELEHIKEDLPHRNEFRIEFDPTILRHPICNITPTIPDEFFLREPNLNGIKGLSKKSNALLPSHISYNSIILDMPSIVDYQTLSVALVFAKSALMNPGHFTDNNYDIEKEKTQAQYFAFSIGIMLNIIDNIPKGQNIIAKYLKDIINNMHVIVQPNEFYIKALMAERK